MTPWRLQISAASPMPSISQCHESHVGRLEGVVVALDPGPDDHVGAERAGELRALAHDPPRLGAHVLVGVDEAAAAEARVEVQAAGDAVDVVVAERRLDVAEVLVRELLRVVELVAVDQVAEALDRAVHLLGDRFGVVGVRRAGSRRERSA